MWLPLVAGAAFAGDALTVKWSFRNIEDGYDHDNRMDVFVDGVKTAESSVAPQSKPGKLSVKLPEGGHEVRVVAMALYGGVWEEHTVVNEYSVDCEWVGQVRGKHKVTLVFDLDSGTLVR